MTDATRRLVGAGCFLAALWILVYWLWQPARPAVSFARGDEPAPGVRLGENRAADAVREPNPTPADPRPEPPPVREPRVEPPAAPLPPGPDVSRPPATTPGFRDYTIREGDTFASIARRELGGERHAEAIARANPLKDPRRLRVGDVIRLPLDPSNIQGGEPAPDPAPTTPAREAVRGATVTYTVETGDSLTKISQLFYGTVRHANLIFEANRDQLRSVDDVRAGQVIRIPPKPE